MRKKFYRVEKGSSSGWCTKTYDVKYFQSMDNVVDYLKSEKVTSAKETHLSHGCFHDWWYKQEENQYLYENICERMFFAEHEYCYEVTECRFEENNF